MKEEKTEAEGFLDHYLVIPKLLNFFAAGLENYSLVYDHHMGLHLFGSESLIPGALLCLMIVKFIGALFWGSYANRTGNTKGVLILTATMSFIFEMILQVYLHYFSRAVDELSNCIVTCSVSVVIWLCRSAIWPLTEGYSFELIESKGLDSTRLSTIHAARYLYLLLSIPTSILSSHILAKYDDLIGIGFSAFYHIKFIATVIIFLPRKSSKTDLKCNSPILSALRQSSFGSILYIAFVSALGMDSFETVFNQVSPGLLSTIIGCSVAFTLLLILSIFSQKLFYKISIILSQITFITSILLATFMELFAFPVLPILKALNLYITVYFTTYVVPQTLRTAAFAMIYAMDVGLAPAAVGLLSIQDTFFHIPGPIQLDCLIPVILSASVIVAVIFISLK